MFFDRIVFLFSHQANKGTKLAITIKLKTSAK